MKTIYLLILICLASCSHSTMSLERKIATDINISWNFKSFNFLNLEFAYTPFFVKKDKFVFFSGGAGAEAGNGVLKWETDFNGKVITPRKIVIKTGPDFKNYNYFRSPRIAKMGDELWMIIEIAGCYNGCSSEKYPKSLALYHSSDEGDNFEFKGFLKVDGRHYQANWFGHTGLIYNPNGDDFLNLEDLTKNRFVTIGEDRDILVSNDGINYQSVKINYPFPSDRLVFASIIKTPYGYQMTSTSNWSDRYYTMTIRHTFSKDLRNWISLEDYSVIKNTNFYKGVHLNYNEETNTVYALSPCERSGCAILATLNPIIDTINDKGDEELKNGDFVLYNKKSAMIIGSDLRDNKVHYKIRFYNGIIDSGYTKEMFLLPLKHYQRKGCIGDVFSSYCVGDVVSVNKEVAAIIGVQRFGNEVKYALRFKNGRIDTGYLKSMLSKLK